MPKEWPGHNPAPPDTYKLASNYDTATIEVDPTVLWLMGTMKMQLSNNEISGIIGSIHETWGGLKLGWAGETQATAEEFFHRWDLSMAAMFGRPQIEQTVSGAEHNDMPPAGEALLPKIQWAVTQASSNFAHAEGAIKEMFELFRDPGPAESAKYPNGYTPPPLPPSDAYDLDVVYE